MTTLLNTQLQQVIDELNQFATSDLIEIYNEYADQNSYEKIYDLDEMTINDIYTSPYDALRDSNHKNFDDRDYYFTYNGYAHMVTFSNEDDDNCPIDLEELAQWLIDENKLSDYDIDLETE